MSMYELTEQNLRDAIIAEASITHPNYDVIKSIAAILRSHGKDPAKIVAVNSNGPVHRVFDATLLPTLRSDDGRVLSPKLPPEISPGEPPE